MTGRPGKGALLREPSLGRQPKAVTKFLQKLRRTVLARLVDQGTIAARLPRGTGAGSVRAKRRFGPMFAAEIRKRRVARMRSYPQWRWHPFIRLTLKVSKGEGREARESGLRLNA